MGSLYRPPSHPAPVLCFVTIVCLPIVILLRMKAVVVWLLVVAVIASASGFRCHTAGKFPDKKHCNTYHVCDVHLGHEKVVCSEGYLYDQSNSNCEQAEFVTCKKGRKFGNQGVPQGREALLRMMNRYRK